MRRRPKPTREAPPWGRRKLLILLAAAAVAVALVLAGMGLSIYYMLHPDSSATAAVENGTQPVAAGDPRDALAARPMPTAPRDAAHPGPLTTQPFAVLRLPGARHLGVAGVSTGFPRTRQGALAQLIGIDQAALQAASVPGAQTVISGWAARGGPTPRSWSGVKAVAALLSSAGLPDAGSPSLTVTATPALGLIKGAVGQGYVVACVDFVVAATLTSTARVAAADCQRMVWTGQHDGTWRNGRWMVGPGPEPAPPPSVWPGTEAAHGVGYQELRYE